MMLSNYNAPTPHDAEALGQMVGSATRRSRTAADGADVVEARLIGAAQPATYSEADSPHVTRAHLGIGSSRPSSQKAFA